MAQKKTREQIARERLEESPTWQTIRSLNTDDASLKMETDYMDRQVKKTAERNLDRGAMEKMRAAKYEASKTEEILNALKKRKKLKSTAY